MITTKRVFLCGLLIFFVALASAGELSFSKSFLDRIEKLHGDYAKRRLVSWEKLIRKHKSSSENEKLEAVNTFFNLLQYARDIHHWGKSDYWATPLEFVVSGKGDCEDFAVAKYFTLREMGVPDEKLLVEYVKILQSGTGFDQAHMVLLYYPEPNAVPLVLDNYNKELLPADKRTDLKPIYGFNGSGLWQAKELGKGNKIGEASDLKRWADLESRMKSGKISTWKKE